MNSNWIKVRHTGEEWTCQDETGGDPWSTGAETELSRLSLQVGLQKFTPNRDPHGRPTWVRFDADDCPIGRYGPQVLRSLRIGPPPSKAYRHTEEVLTVAVDKSFIGLHQLPYKLDGTLGATSTIIYRDDEARWLRAHLEAVVPAATPTGINYDPVAMDWTHSDE